MRLLFRVAFLLKLEFPYDPSRGTAEPVPALSALPLSARPRRIQLTYPSPSLYLLYIKGIIIVEVQQHDSLEERNPDLVFSTFESSGKRDGPQLRAPGQLSITMLSSVPLCERVDRALQFRRELEVPSVFELRIAVGQMCRA